MTTVPHFQYAHNTVGVEGGVHRRAGGGALPHLLGAGQSLEMRDPLRRHCGGEHLPEDESDQVGGLAQLGGFQLLYVDRGCRPFLFI